MPQKARAKPGFEKKLESREPFLREWCNEYACSYLSAAASFCITNNIQTKSYLYLLFYSTWHWV